MEKHVVLVAFPAQGHLSPMMHLASKLVALGGIRITFIASDKLVDAAIALREKCFEELINVVPIFKGAMEAKHWKGNPSGFVALHHAAFEMEEPLEEMLRGFLGEGGVGIHCLVGDAFLALLQDVANRLGIQRVAFWTSNASSAIPNHFVKELKDAGYVPVQERIKVDGNIPVQGIPAMEKYRIGDLPFSFHESHQENLEMRIATTGRVREAACVLVSTFEELEHESLEQMRTLMPAVFPVGPLLPNSFFDDGDDAARKTKKTSGPRAGIWNEDWECLDWLDTQKPASVLYISFGSLANLSLVQLEELAMGLLASRAAFLWVIRPNLVDGAAGSSSTFNEFVRRTKESGSGKIIAWAPQLEVLRHPAVCMFLTHCGWNSITEAICSGVPVLAWPCFAEQNMNARCVVDEWKIGVAFEGAMVKPGGLVDRKEVEQVIRRGMEDHDIAKNVKRLRDVAEAENSSSSSLAGFVTQFA